MGEKRRLFQQCPKVINSPYLAVFQQYTFSLYLLRFQPTSISPRLQSPHCQQQIFFINRPEKTSLFNTVLIIFPSKCRIFIAVIQFIRAAVLLGSPSQRRRDTNFRNRPSGTVMGYIDYKSIAAIRNFFAHKCKSPDCQLHTGVRCNPF